MNDDPETSMRKVDVPFEFHLGLEDRTENQEDDRLEKSRPNTEFVAVTPHTHLPQTKG